MDHIKEIRALKKEINKLKKQQGKLIRDSYILHNLIKELENRNLIKKVYDHTFKKRVAYPKRAGK